MFVRVILRRQTPLLVAALALIALVGARPYAGGWNDGTRLATVEALVDYHSFAIDNSVFVKVPADGRPYPDTDPLLQKIGTSDKLLIDGHYYTDKPPVPAVLLAGGCRSVIVRGDLPESVQQYATLLVPIGVNLDAALLTQDLTEMLQNI